MNELSKQEKLEKILLKIKSNNLTAYKISEETSLNESGINKIIRGDVKNPHTSTVNILYNYLYGNNTVTTNQGFISFRGSEVPIEEWALITASNEEALMTQLVFSNIIDIRVAKKLASLSSDKEALKEFLGLK